MLPHRTHTVRTLCLSLCLAVFCATRCSAGQIDLRLDVDYAGGSPGGGGSWTLYAKTDEQGLFSLRTPLTGINSTVTNELPIGRVNGSATNNAGFATFVNVPAGSSRDLFFGQQVAPAGSGQQGVFYGVGTLEDGSPNFPGQQGGTNSLGPNLTTLSSVQNVPWAQDDPFWSTGVTVASGLFSAGSTPAFGVGSFEGSLLTTIGNSTTPGARTNDVQFTTLVRTNLGFGVATGDYNLDGVVDAADYTVWRDTLNLTVTPLTGADGNGDGLINAADRVVWSANYGSSASSMALSVPEPSALGLFALALLASGLSARPCGV